MSEAGLEFDNGNQGENRNNWVGFSKISTGVCNNNNNNNNNTKQYNTKTENDFSNGNNVYDKIKGSTVQDNNSTYDYGTSVQEDNGIYVQDCTPRHKDLSYPSHPNKRAGFLRPSVCSYLESQGTEKVQRKTTSLILNLQSNNNTLIAGCRGLNRRSEDQGSSRSSEDQGSNRSREDQELERDREDPGLDLTWIPPPLTPDQEMREKLFPDTQSQVSTPPTPFADRDGLLVTPGEKNTRLLETPGEQSCSLLETPGEQNTRLLETPGEQTRSLLETLGHGGQTSSLLETPGDQTRSLLETTNDQTNSLLETSGEQTRNLKITWKKQTSDEDLNNTTTTLIGPSEDKTHGIMNSKSTNNNISKIFNQNRQRIENINGFLENKPYNNRSTCNTMSIKVSGKWSTCDSTSEYSSGNGNIFYTVESNRATKNNINEIDKSGIKIMKLNAPNTSGNWSKFSAVPNINKTMEKDTKITRTIKDVLKKSTEEEGSYREIDVKENIETTDGRIGNNLKSEENLYKEDSLVNKVICILTPPPTPFQDRGCILDQLSRIQGYQETSDILSTEDQKENLPVNQSIPPPPAFS